MRLISFAMLAATGAGLFSWTVDPVDPAEPQVTADGDRAVFEEEIFLAVLEGLYRDGVQNAAVDAIVAEDPESGYPVNFVYACPICTPAMSAFQAYRARPGFYKDKQGRDAFGSGLAPELVTRLTSTDAPDQAGDRQAAIRDLIEGWIAERLEAKRPTGAERAAWLAEMTERRNEGLSYLERYREEGIPCYATMEACAFCDGAQAACQRTQ
jgi:hypothetical protein